MNAKILIETNLIKNLTVDVKGQIIFPSIVSSNIIKFDKIEVGGFEQRPIIIHNPSSHPIELQFFLAHKNFYNDISEKLLQTNKIPMWAELCSITFSNDLRLKKECDKFG